MPPLPSELVCAAAPPRGSRRRRLWELDANSHCPVLGVCLPMEVLRKLVGKALGGEALATDYELHCGAVTDSRVRNPVAEAIQKELDRRYALAVHKAAGLKNAAALAAWWEEAVRDQDVAGPLWAVLTHARCTPELAHWVGSQVHMLQHQLGVAMRVDRERLAALAGENAVLSRELARAQQRCQRLAEDQAHLVESLRGTILQLRGQVLVKDSLIQSLRDDRSALEAASPELGTRAELAQTLRQANEARQDLQRALKKAQHDNEWLQREVDALKHGAAASPEASCAPAPSAPAAPAAAEPPRLDEQAVLCVGGRPASVPVYRQVIEGTGGRFLHHDGGDKDNPAKLDATLAAADLVICQTGCISHDAYWRVKNHCKRTGKRCVFVESPSSAGLKRALASL